MSNETNLPMPDAIYMGLETKTNANGGEKQFYSGELHCILFGPNGVGKGMRLLVPNLLHMAEKSIVVIDPKGQLAAMTAKWRYESGNDVKIIDPFGVLAGIVKKRPDDYKDLIKYGLVESAGFNPLAALDPDGATFYDDAAVIAEALIKIQGNDPHWPESAQGLITGLIMWARTEYGKSATLADVRRLLTEADKYEQRPTLDDEGNEIIDADGNPVMGQFLDKGLRATAMRMVHSGVFEIESLGARFTAKNPTDELESVKSTADTQTRWLLSRPMREDLSKSGVDFRKLKTGTKPLTVYVILPAHYLETHSVWLRLVVSEALRANMTDGGRRILLMLDEFAALGYLPIVERLFGVTRDYRIQMWPVFQDLPQLKGLYKDRWETLLGMAGVVQSFRAGDLTTAKWISERSGTTTRLFANVGQTAGSGHGGASSGSSMGLSEKEGPVIKPAEVFEYSSLESVVYLAGQTAPERLYMPHFTKMKSIRNLALPNPYYVAPNDHGAIGAVKTTLGDKV